MKFCPNCGTQVPKDATFCTKCGYKISSKDSNSSKADNNVVKAPDVVSNQGALASTTNKKINKKTKLAIVIAVVVVLAGIFGWYKYQRMPARNPQNPLSHQTFVIERYKSDGYTLYAFSKDATGSVFKKLAYLCYKKLGANEELLNQINEIPNKNWYYFWSFGGHDYRVDKVLNKNKVYKKEFMKDYQQTGSVLLLDPRSDLHEGQKVTVNLLLDSNFAKKYGIDRTPLKIKVSQIKNVKNYE